MTNFDGCVIVKTSGHFDNFGIEVENMREDRLSDIYKALLNAIAMPVVLHPDEIPNGLIQ